jgi:hypothetical protein
MELKKYMKIGSGVIELTKDRKLKKNHRIQLNFVFLAGYNETWSSSRISSRASIVHNTYNDLLLRINSVSEPIYLLMVLVSLQAEI